MTTVLSKLKSKISENLTSLTSTKYISSDEKYIEKLFSSKNLKEIESSLSPKSLLELKKK